MIIVISKEGKILIESVHNQKVMGCVKTVSTEKLDKGTKFSSIMR